MATPVTHPPADVPADALATCDDLAEVHAQLRRRGVHSRPGGWVVARPDDVAQALASPALGVAPGRPVGAARALQARTARFSDGPQHAARRALLERLLPGPAGLRAAAQELTAAAAQHGTWDVVPLARRVPVLVLAARLGVPAPAVPRVAELVGRLCDAMAPSRDPSPPGDGAAEELSALLAPLGPEHVAALVGLLLQARDATAALIGAALLDPSPDPVAAVDRALRQAAPVQCTRRTALERVDLGGVAVPAGAPVWVVLAAADRGAPHRPATFGAGPHACPGAEHAVALARGVLDGLRAVGCRPVPDQPVRHERRPNLRLPATVLVVRP